MATYSSASHESAHRWESAQRNGGCVCRGVACRQAAAGRRLPAGRPRGTPGRSVRADPCRCRVPPSQQRSGDAGGIRRTVSLHRRTSKPISRRTRPRRTPARRRATNTPRLCREARRAIRWRPPPSRLQPGRPSIWPAGRAFPAMNSWRELGHGGMGVVYLARHLQLGRLVALKMIRGDRRIGTDDLVRFRIEAEAVARLKHPHIVQIFEIGAVDDRPYFSLEYVEHGSLDARIKRAPLALRVGRPSGRDPRPGHAPRPSGQHCPSRPQTGERAPGGERRGNRRCYRPRRRRRNSSRRKSPTSGLPSGWATTAAKPSTAP